MATLEGRPKLAIIKQPRGDERLREFSTGSREKWETDVNNLVRELFEYGLEFYPRLTVLAMTSEAGDILGLCAWRPKKLEPTPPTLEPPPEPPYIHLIGISKQFRGDRTQEGERLGCALLVGALRAIDVQWTDTVMPEVWALVSRENIDSHELFARHGFELIKKKDGDDRRYRPPGLQIF